MKHLTSIVMMQLKDKLDFGFLNSRKATINKIVFTLLKFVLVSLIAWGTFKVCSVLNVFSLAGAIPNTVMCVVLTLLLVLSTISCTVGLIKTLYFGEDNKLLITFPVNGNIVYISKLILYYCFELIRSVMITVPIFIGFGIVTRMNVLYYIWLFFVFIFVSMIPVLLGAVLSIFGMWILRFLKKVPFVGAILFLGVIGLCVYGLTLLIGMIPENLSILNSWGKIYWKIQDVLVWWKNAFIPVYYIVSLVAGKLNGFRYKVFTAQTPIYFGMLIGVLVVLFVIVFFASRPLFFGMMTKNFEFDKKATIGKHKNRCHKKWWTYIIKEFRINVRNSEFSYNYLAVYIAVPLLIFLLNKIFAAMNTRLQGDYMVYMFNILIIILPILASNSLIATMYSREGRAAYIKKTKPIKLVFPLTAKLIFYIIGSTVSLGVSVYIFGMFSPFSLFALIMLFLGLAFVNTAHIFWCAMLDIMNPQNEQYSTAGESYNNPNELKATILAFVIAVLLTLFSFMLFKEGITKACVKIACIGLVMLVSMIYMFVNKIIIYYAER